MTHRTGDAAATAEDVDVARDVVATATAVTRDPAGSARSKKNTSQSTDGRRWYAKWMRWIRGVDDEE